MRPWFLLIVCLPVTAVAAEITGPARVLDGDSLRIGEVEIRLHGIDAPEFLQSCRHSGHDRPCGRDAATALERLTGGNPVRCTWTVADRYGRALGTCFADGANVAAALVEQGMALAYRRYSDAYVGHEDRARARGAGIWATEFETPWDWRQRMRRAQDELAAVDCPVKGNVNSRGKRIYHEKGWRDYAKVRMQPAQGDRCFNTAAEAVAAGFRPARR